MSLMATMFKFVGKSVPTLVGTAFKLKISGLLPHIIEQKNNLKSGCNVA